MPLVVWAGWPGACEAGAGTTLRIASGRCSTHAGRPRTAPGTNGGWSARGSQGQERHGDVPRGGRSHVSETIASSTPAAEAARRVLEAQLGSRALTPSVANDTSMRRPRRRSKTRGCLSSRGYTAGGGEEEERAGTRGRAVMQDAYDIPCDRSDTPVDVEEAAQRLEA